MVIFHVDEFLMPCSILMHLAARASVAQLPRLGNSLNSILRVFQELCCIWHQRLKSKLCREFLSHHWVTWLSSVGKSQVFKLKLEFKSDIWSAMRSGIVANVSDACTFYFSCLVIRWHSAHIVHLSSNTWHAQWAQAGVILYNLLTGRTFCRFTDEPLESIQMCQMSGDYPFMATWPLPKGKTMEWPKT